MGKARRIAVVGAGLGGLAAAIALRRRGFEVQVYEQAPELAEFGAGINISPNSVKFFHAVGLADRLHAVGSEPVGLCWRDWRTGEIRYSLPFEDFATRYGARYYVVHRSDLHRLLSEAVPEAAIALAKRCTAVEARNGAVGLAFADGSSAEADVVVGCDGIRSAVRAAVFGGEGPRYVGTMCWRALAPAEALPKDRHDRYVNQWSGDGGFVISYTIRQGKYVNFVAVRQQPGWTEPSWSVPSSVEEMLAAFPHAGDGPGDPPRRRRARHARDLRPGRQHGVRGRLRAGRMARRLRRRSGGGAPRLRGGAEAARHPRAAALAHRGPLQEAALGLGPAAPRVRFRD
jgi:salicylate hydroxylase